MSAYLILHYSDLQISDIISKLFGLSKEVTRARICQIIVCSHDKILLLFIYTFTDDQT